MEKKITNNEVKYFSKSSMDKKIIPNFLIDKNQNDEDLNSLLAGLKIVGDFLDKTILKPNNLTSPLSRTLFINNLN